MNSKRSWISNQILKYSFNRRWEKTYKNNNAVHKLNISPFRNNKLLQIDNMKRLMSSDSKISECPKDEKKSSGCECPKDEKKPSISDCPKDEKKSLVSESPKDEIKSSGSGSGSGPGKGKFPGRHCFHEDMEKILNRQAHEEYLAAFGYLSMALYFGRTGVALPGCQGFFMNMYEEELGHGNIFVNYVLMRGGHVTLADITMPCEKEYTVKGAFEKATEMEMHIKEKLVEVFDVAEKHKDLQVMDLVSTEFMEEQNSSICQMARLRTRAKIVDTPVGEHLFDQFIFNSFVKTEDDNLMNKRNLDLERSKHDIYK